MAVEEIQRSPFVRTEIPEPLKMTFKTPEGTPLSLNQYSVFKVDVLDPDKHYTEKDAQLVEGESNNILKYEFEPDDLSKAGQYRFQFWAASGDPLTSKLYSSIVVLSVFNNLHDQQVEPEPEPEE